jgi:hypothetical protein
MGHGSISTAAELSRRFWRLLTFLLPVTVAAVPPFELAV